MEFNDLQLNEMVSRTYDEVLEVMNTVMGMLRISTCEVRKDSLHSILADLEDTRLAIESIPFFKVSYEQKRKHTLMYR